LHCFSGRRNFLSGIAAGGLTQLPEAARAADDRLNIVGPKSGYTPQIGTLVSMLSWMRPQILGVVKGMTCESST